MYAVGPATNVPEDMGAKSELISYQASGEARRADGQR
jgi:hypothetical protein